MTPAITFGIDNTAPTISAVHTLDRDLNGQLDAVKITFADAFSANIKDTSVTASDFTVTGYVNPTFVPAETVSGDHENDNIIVIGFDEIGPDTNATPNVAYAAGSLTDNYSQGNAVISDATNASIDAAVPVMVSVTNYDATTDNGPTAGQDGRNDEIYVMFSEPISDASITGYDDFSADDDAGGTYPVSLMKKAAPLHGYTDAADDEYVTLMGPGQLVGTDKEGVQLSGSVTDMNGMATTASQTIAYNAGSGNNDGAAPQYLSSVTLDNNNDGVVDYVKITYSEAMEDSTVVATDYAVGIADTTGVNLIESFSSLTPSTGNAIDVANDSVIYIGVADGTETLSADKTDYTLKIQQIGLVDDLNSNPLASFASKTSTDGAKPLLLSTHATTITNDNGVGKTTTLAMKYSEDVSANSSNTVGDYTVEIAGTATGIVVTSVNRTTSTVTLNLSAADLNQTTKQLQVSYTGGIIKDEAGSSDNSGAAVSDLGITDAANPSILYTETRDLDGNGQIDALYVKFSEAIEDDGVRANDFTVGAFATAFSAAADCSGAATRTADSDYICLGLVESGTPDTSATPAVSYTGDSPTDPDIQDKATIANTIVDYVAVNALDKASPVALMTDVATATVPNVAPNGLTKSVQVKYSEELSIAPSANSFSVKNSLDTAVDVSGVALDGGDASIAVLSLSQVDTDNDTSKMKVAYSTGGTTHASDSASNLAVALASTSVQTDGVAPFALTSTYIDSDFDGQVDRVDITFSEDIEDDGYDAADYTTAVAGTVALTNESATSIPTSRVLAIDILGAADVTGGATNPQITYTDNFVDASRGLNDAANNAVATFTIAATDNADPSLLTAHAATKTMGNASGKTTTMALKFSEDVSGTGAASTNTGSYLVELDGTSTSIDVSSVGVTTDTITLNLDTADGDQTTAALKVSFT